jgi:hypothetical protein
MSDNFEHSIRRKFENFESEVSPDLFDKIQTARDRKKRAGLIFLRKWGWTAAALLLLSSMLVYWSYQILSNTDNLIPNSKMEVNSGQKPEHSQQNGPQQLKDHSLDIDQDHGAEIDKQTPNQFQDNYVPIRAEDLNSRDSDKQSDERERTEDESSLDGSMADNVNNEASNSHDPTVEDTDPIDEHSVLIPEMQENEPDPDGQEDSPDQTEQIPPVQPAKISNWNLDIYAGPGLGYRMLNGTDAAYRELRDNTETAALSYQAGVMLNYNLSPKWKLGIGLRYSGINTNFDYNRNWSVTDTTITRHEDIVINPPPIGNQTIIWYDTSYQINNFSKKYSSHNQLNLLTIPLEIERSFYFGDKWSVMAKAGISASIFNKRSGLISSPIGEVLNLGDLPAMGLGQLNSSLGLGLAYRLNQKMSLMFYPQMNYNLLSGYEKSLGFDQRDYGVYTHFGIRIDL